MKENGSNYPAFPDYNTRSTKSPRLVIVIVGIFLLLVVIFGGLFILGTLNKKPKVILKPVPTIAATETPLPTSSVSAVLTPVLTGTLSPTAGLSTQDKSTNLDRSKLHVTVLNGSGETGAARQVSTYLESLGYKIDRVGNADVFTYRNLTIKAKKSMSAYAPLLKKDLQANPVFASVSATISDDISGEVEVVVGR